MTKCYQPEIRFSSLSRRKITADFTGGDLTSNAGLLLLRECDRRHGLSSAVARVINGPRRASSVAHQAEQLVRQRRLLAIVSRWWRLFRIGVDVPGVAVLSLQRKRFGFPLDVIEPP